MGYDVDPDQNAEQEHASHYRHNPLMGAIPESDPGQRRAPRRGCRAVERSARFRRTMSWRKPPPRPRPPFEPIAFDDGDERREPAEEARAGSPAAETADTDSQDAEAQDGRGTRHRCAKRRAAGHTRRRPRRCWRSSRMPHRAHPLPHPSSSRQPGSAVAAKDKTAFTLRLDQQRHLQLRLACAVAQCERPEAGHQRARRSARRDARTGRTHAPSADTSVMKSHRTRTMKASFLVRLATSGALFALTTRRLFDRYARPAFLGFRRRARPPNRRSRAQAKAQKALSKGRTDDAIGYAEAAVLTDPDNADLRRPARPSLSVRGTLPVRRRQLPRGHDAGPQRCALGDRSGAGPIPRRAMSAPRGSCSMTTAAPRFRSPITAWLSRWPGTANARSTS